MGDEKLLDQIGNTITYYTRAHVVKSGDVMEEMKDKDDDIIKAAKEKADQDYQGGGAYRAFLKLFYKNLMEEKEKEKEKDEV